MRELRAYKDEEGRTQITMAKSESEQDQICDFCSGQDRPFKRFMAHDFDAMAGINSLGAWLACPACARMIEARNTEGLLHRSLDAFEDPNVPRWFAEQSLRTIHGKFFQNLISDS